MKQCFVIMPIGSEDDYAKYKDIYECMIKEAVEDAGLELQCIRADEVSKSGAIIKDIIKRLYEADVVIADLSGLNANVFYELGVRHALKGGTIMIVDDIKSIPFDLKPYRVLEYSTTPRGISNFKRDLKRFLQSALDDPRGEDNPVLDFLPRPELERVEQAEAIHNRQLIYELRSEVAEKTRILADEIESLRQERARYAPPTSEVRREISSEVKVVIETLTKRIERLEKAAAVAERVPEAKVEKTAEQWLEDASAAYAVGNCQEVVEACSKAIELDPKLARAYVNRGVAYYIMGELDKAMADYNKAIKLNPDDAWAYYNRGVTNRKLGETEKAITDYNKAIELDPKYVDAYVNRGVAYCKMGEFEKAMADYNKAIELDPGYARAYVNRGVAYYIMGELDKAMADYNKALEIGPLLFAANFNTGLVLYEMDRLEKAVQMWDEVARFHPQEAEAHAGLGLGLWKMGEKDRAVQEYRRALGLESRFDDTEWMKSEYFWSDKAITDVRPLIKEAKKSKP